MSNNTLKSEFDPKKFEIKKPGIYVLIGMLHSKRTKVTDKLVRDTVKWMVRIHPKNKTLQKIFYEEVKSVLSWSTMRPRPIAGSKGSWVAYGPITQKFFKQTEARDIWGDLVNFIDDKFPFTGNIVRIKAVIHNDHSRDPLKMVEYRPFNTKLLDIFGGDTDDEDEFDYEEFIQSRMPTPSVLVDDETFKSQKRITDFFG